MRLRTDQKVMCEVQGRMFELALKKGYDCPKFIEKFMNSRVAADADLTFNKNQWMGEEYLIEELSDEAGGLPEAGITYDKEMMYWCGYIYRYWHYYTGESSKEIYDTANAEIMNMCWPAYHTLDVEMAIDRLRESNDDDRKRNDLKERIYAFLKNNPNSSWNEIANNIRDHSVWAYKIISEMEEAGLITLSSIEALQDRQESSKYRAAYRATTADPGAQQKDEGMLKKTRGADKEKL